MSEIAVRARNLTKSYTLYPTPWERMREIIGFRRRKGANYPEHIAVDGIDLEIRFGEKVGFIGRNGAGKSTLLKLITGVIEPTSGMLDINGETHALLQMGAGFHQDFTGRENALGYLANLGVSGDQADRLIEDIIEFSELEEYIDQPLKTYSTGMQMRLIFAASTTVAPKLFVVDEVLGVGDAYFQQKSFARIQELCEKNQTTLLLVSHDIYTAAKICDRMIWIDRGRIKYDGEPKIALNLYEASIKEQEEQRLRRKATMISTSRTRAQAAGQRAVLMELRPVDGKLAGPVEIGAARIVGRDSATLATLRRARTTAGGNAQATDTAAVVFETVDDASSWQYSGENGAATKIALVNHGSVFHKGVMKAELPAGDPLPDAHFELVSAVDQALATIIYGDDHRAYLAGRKDLRAGVSEQVTIPLSVAGLEELRTDPAQAANVRHGSGGIRITSIDILDAAGHSTRQLRQGESYTIEFAYELADPSLTDTSEMIIAIARDGVLDCMRIFNGALRLEGKSGAITVAIDALPLANGNFVLSALLAKRGYYASGVATSYTLNNDVYEVLSRALEFVVTESHAALKGTVFNGTGVWMVEGRGDTPRAGVAAASNDMRMQSE